jgi:Flp pilus assembly protein TadD
VSTSESPLDAEELLHLALRAMEADRSEDAITFLKRALVLAPDDGRLHFLLGAVHADIGLDERAVDELARAAQLAPELHAAHFQLGTLLLKRGDLQRASDAWRPLELLDRDHPLRLYASALTRLAEGDYTRCIDDLRHGIAQGDEKAAYAAEMREVLARTEALMAAEAGSAPAEVASLASPAAAAAAPKRKDFDAQHVLLAGYDLPTDVKRR